MKITMEWLMALCQDDRIKWSQHAMKRLRERHITIDDYIQCIQTGSIIEDYPDDYPIPSCLILGVSASGKALHIVVGCDGKDIYAITAYWPSPDVWEADLKTRKEDS